MTIPSDLRYIRTHIILAFIDYIVPVVTGAERNRNLVSIVADVVAPVDRETANRYEGQGLRLAATYVRAEVCRPPTRHPVCIPQPQPREGHTEPLNRPDHCHVGFRPNRGGLLTVNIREGGAQMLHVLGGSSWWSKY